MPQLSVYVARGILIESKKPTWLYGTASEHSTFYQYSFYKAQNIHAGMIQTESPYYQPNPKPPIPFDTITKFPGDPDFGPCRSNANASGCDSSWAVRMERSTDISVAGAGLYSWFNIYDESCVDPRTCQTSLVYLKNNGKNILFLNLVTIGSKNMVTTSKGEISAADNELAAGHPKWSHIAGLQISGDGFGPDDPIVYIDPTVWVQSSPTVVCAPPCTLVLPPSVLPSETTISISSYTTSLEIGWTSKGVFTGSTVTTTISIPPVTTKIINYSNVPINNSTDIFKIIPTMSVMPKPVVITDTYPPGITGSPPTRTITPPPFPWSGSIIGTGVVYTTYVLGTSTIWLEPNQTSTTTTDGHTIVFLPTGIIVDGQPPIPPPISKPTTTYGITIGPPPTFISEYPTRTVEFVTTDVPKPTTTNIDGKVYPVIPCHAWFFFICTDRIKGLILFGFELPGIHGPGGPPPLPPRPPLPPGINWPPTTQWPKIITGWDGTPSYDPYDPEEDPECETTTSKNCETTVSQGPTTTFTGTPTCETLTGCSVTGSSTTTTTSACGIARATPGMSKREASILSKRAAPCGKWAVIIPRNHDNAAEIQSIQQGIDSAGVTGVYQSQGRLGTMFWSVERMTDDQMKNLQDAHPEVSVT
jgi:hypothetical protein